MRSVFGIPRWKSRLLAAGLAGISAWASAAQPDSDVPPPPPDFGQPENQGPGGLPPGAPPNPPSSSSGGFRQGESTTIDLASALQLAGVRNPEIMLARERVTETVAIRQFAAAQILPNLNAGTNFDTHSGNLQQSSGHILDVSRSALFVGSGANAIAAGSVNIPGVMWNQNISQGIFTYLVARQTVRQQQFASQATRNQVLLRVSLAYTELLRASGRRAIAIRIRDDAAEIARLTAAYARSGQGRQADADRAATELGKRETDLMVAEGELLMASSRMAQLLNLEPTVGLRPAEAWVVPMPLVPEPITLQELIAMAALRRPELGAQREMIQVALLNLRGARVLPFSPTTLVGFSAGTFGGGSNLQPVRFGNFASREDFDVVAYWTLQNMGVGNKVQIDLARSRQRQANLRLIETLNAVRLEVANAYSRSKVRFAQVGTAERAVRTGIDSFDEDMKRIKNNEGLPIEVLDSLRLLGRARFEYLDAIAEYNAAQFELYVSLGQPPANALARPAEDSGSSPGGAQGSGMPAPPREDAPPEARRPAAPKLTVR
ncbi:MAG TPA: TolC family protein [Pirellulales bacterium]|jgi:outer membrane protein TolC|nr:TolC family protein [Pirellulales bacterium]